MRTCKIHNVRGIATFGDCPECLKAKVANQVLRQALEPGDVIQRGDVFLADDGRYLEMDDQGRLLGIRCLGATVMRDNGWFRPLPNV
jgi:hypothetical protein